MPVQVLLLLGVWLYVLNTQGRVRAHGYLFRFVPSSGFPVIEREACP